MIFKRTILTIHYLKFAMLVFHSRYAKKMLTNRLFSLKARNATKGNNKLTQKMLLNTASFLKHAKLSNNVAQNYQMIVLLHNLPFENRVCIAEILKAA